MKRITKVGGGWIIETDNVDATVFPKPDDNAYTEADLPMLLRRVAAVLEGKRG